MLDQDFLDELNKQGTLYLFRVRDLSEGDFQELLNQLSQITRSIRIDTQIAENFIEKNPKKLEMIFNSIHNVVMPVTNLTLLNALQNNNTIPHLSLNLNNLGPEGIRHLAEALRGNTRLTTLNLNLGLNNLGPEGIRHLADALQSNISLTILNLNLSTNNLGPEGIRYLAEALRSNTRLTTLNLNLGYNHLGPEGIRHLADVLRKNTTITHLNLSGISGGDNSIDIGMEAIINAMENNYSITDVNIADNNVTQ